MQDVPARPATDQPLMPTPVSEGDKADGGKVYYSVQLFTSPVQVAADDNRLRKGGDDVTFYIQDKTYKYISGKHSSLNKAKKSLRKLRKHFPDAFIIKMRDGERL